MGQKRCREGKGVSHIKRFKIAPCCHFKIRKAHFFVVRYLPAVSRMHTSTLEGVERLAPVQLHNSFPGCSVNG